MSKNTARRGKRKKCLGDFCGWQEYRQLPRHAEISHASVIEKIRPNLQACITPKMYRSAAKLEAPPKRRRSNSVPQSRALSQPAYIHYKQRTHPYHLYSPSPKSRNRMSAARPSSLPAASEQKPLGLCWSHRRRERRRGAKSDLTHV